MRASMFLTERQQLALAVKKSEEDAMLNNVHKRNASGETPLHINAIKVDPAMPAGPRLTCSSFLAPFSSVMAGQRTHGASASGARRQS